jgi:hypothetical protein
LKSKGLFELIEIVYQFDETRVLLGHIGTPVESIVKIDESGIFDFRVHNGKLMSPFFTWNR